MPRYLILLFSLLVFFDTKGQPMIPYLENELYGFADLKGNIIVPARYNEVSFYNSHHLARVTVGDSCFLLSSTGKKVMPIPCKREPGFELVYSNDSGYDWKDNHGKDTLGNLVALRHTPFSFTLINTTTGVASLKFDFENESTYFRSPPVNANFENHLFIGRLSDTSYQVLNEQLDIVLKSDRRPEIWNDSLVKVYEKSQPVVHNIKSNIKYNIPYSHIFHSVEGEYFIVKKWLPPGSPGTSNRSRERAGIVDKNGEIVIDFNFNLIWGGDDFPIFAQRNDSCFYINLATRTIQSTPFQYVTYLSEDYFRGKLFNGKWSIVNHQGNQVSAEFDTLYTPTTTLYNYINGTKAGVLDSTLTLLMEYEADGIYPVYNFPGYIVTIKNKQGLLDSLGKIIVPANYDYVQVYPHTPFFRVLNNHKMGLLSQNGNILFEPVYDEIDFHGEGGIIVITVKENNGLYTYYDEKLNVIKDSVASNQYGVRDMYTERKNGGFQVVDKFGAPIGPPARKMYYFEVESDSTDFALLLNDSTMNVLRPDGNLLVDSPRIMIKNKDLYCTYCGLFSIRQNKLEGVINHRNEWIIPLRAQQIIKVTQQLIVVKRGKEYFLFDDKGDVADKMPFSEIAVTKHPVLWKVSRGKKFGYLNHKTGLIGIPLVYDQATDFFDQYAVVIKGNAEGSRKTMIIDTTGKVILETNFDNLRPLEEKQQFNLYISTFDAKEGIITINGRVIIPPVFEKIEFYIDTFFYKAELKEQGEVIVNRDHKIVFATNTIPTRAMMISKAEPRFLFFMDQYSVITDEYGQSLKTIPSTSIQFLQGGVPQIDLLQVIEKGKPYFINPTTLVEYRKK